MFRKLAAPLKAVGRQFSVTIAAVAFDKFKKTFPSEFFGLKVKTNGLLPPCQSCLTILTFIRLYYFIFGV
jgi:hypothetical protein